MSANMYTNSRTIEELIEELQENRNVNEKAILNMCLTNGTMGRKDQLKLREIYPNLFDDVMKFLAQKNHGKVHIHKKEGYPDVVSVFIFDKPDEEYIVHKIKRLAGRNIRRLEQEAKLPYDFVYINTPRHKLMITNGLRSYLNWDTSITGYNLEREERECE